MAQSTHAAIAVLIAEHDLCRSRLGAAAEALNGGARTAGPAISQTSALLQFLEHELETHIAKEEGPLFPRLKAALPTGDRLIDEMVAEHDLIRIKREDLSDVLAELLAGHDDLRADRAGLRSALAQSSRTPVSLPQIQQAVDSVAAKLRVHFENEEELVFPLAPDLLSKDELDRIAAEMAALDNRAGE